MRTSTRTRTSTRCLVGCAIAALVGLAFAPAHADKGSARGDSVKAARLLSSWQYTKARTLIAKLAAKAPKKPATRYLQGELAFIDGEYDRVLSLIDGLGDDAVFGNVGSLRSLAATTAEATRSFVSLTSKGGHFVIQHAPGVDQVIAELAGEVLEKAYAEIGADFDFFPVEKIRVAILGAPADLAKV